MICPTRITRDFPSLSDQVYLNTAAEGIPPLCVGTALRQYVEDKLLGMDGRERHFARERECKDVVGQFLGLKADEVAFCSCSAEAYNLLVSAVRLSPGDEVIINDLDFPSGATPWLVHHAAAFRLWHSQEGELSLETLESLLTPVTRLVQVSLVSFYNGYRVDWEGLRARVRSLAPQALLAVDVTQALGRIPITNLGADVVISSTHKWALGIHGGCIVGVPTSSAPRITAQAGGWYNLLDPFAESRFRSAQIKSGAASFAVGMPSFAPIYALNAALRYLEEIGVQAISEHADRLIARLQRGLRLRGIVPLVAESACRPSGIVAFRHLRGGEIHRYLHKAGIHIMYHAGRLRVALHGYNTDQDVDFLLEAMDRVID